MPSKKAVLLTILAIVTSPSMAEAIRSWANLLQENKCVSGDGGFFLWDSKKCLLHNDDLIIDGKRIRLKSEGSIDIKVKRKGATSAGDKLVRTYSADGFVLKLSLTYLPGCYSHELCTFASYFAEFEVIYSDKTKKPLTYQGVGYEGS